MPEGNWQNSEPHGYIFQVIILAYIFPFFFISLFFLQQEEWQELHLGSVTIVEWDRLWCLHFLLHKRLWVENSV